MARMDDLAPLRVLANEHPATSLAGEGDAHFTRLVADRTRKRLAIEPRPDAALGYTSLQQVAAVERGEIAMADSFGGALGEDHRALGLSTLPFVAADPRQARALYLAARRAYTEAFQHRNQVLLYATPWPPSGLWTRAPLRSVHEAAALTVRTYDAVSCSLFAKLGAHARVVSFAELPPRLASGEIDAALSSGDGGAARVLRASLAHFTEIDYAIPLSFTTVNLDFWLWLGEGLRRTVEEAARETESLQWHALDGRIAINRARLRAQGVTVHPPGALREALREAAREAVAAWCAEAGPELAAILEAAPRASAPR